MVGLEGLQLFYILSLELDVGLFQIRNQFALEDGRKRVDISVFDLSIDCFFSDAIGFGLG